MEWDESDRGMRVELGVGLGLDTVMGDGVHKVLAQTECVWA